MCVHLCTKFKVSSIILTSFRQGIIFLPPSPSSKLTPKNPTQIRVKKTTQRNLSMKVNVSMSILM